MTCLGTGIRVAALGGGESVLQMSCSGTAGTHDKGMDNTEHLQFINIGTLRMIL